MSAEYTALKSDSALSTQHSALLTIVLVNYRARDLLVACLAALEAAPPRVPYRVVLVDNSPGDGTAEAVAARFPAVEVVSNAVNVGFGRACNQAIRASASPYVLLLNPDTEVQPGA